MAPKDADGMTNTVDPDQTPPASFRGSLIWVYTVYPDPSIRKLRIITVLLSTPDINTYY